MYKVGSILMTLPGLLEPRPLATSEAPTIPVCMVHMGILKPIYPVTKVLDKPL